MYCCLGFSLCIQIQTDLLVILCIDENVLYKGKENYCQHVNMNGTWNVEAMTHMHYIFNMTLLSNIWSVTLFTKSGEVFSNPSRITMIDASRE